MIRYFSVVLFCMCVALLSCQKDGCDSVFKDVQCLSTIGCGDRAYDLVVESDNDFELIRSQKEYNEKITGDCQVTIDWTQYDLVIGNVDITQDLHSVSKKLTRDCNNNVFNLSITMKLTAIERKRKICWSALVPKLGVEETIFVHL